MSKRKISVQEIVEIVTNADDSDLSKLSKEEERNNKGYEVAPSRNELSDAVESNGGDSTDEDDNWPFIVHYRWRQKTCLQMIKTWLPQEKHQYTGEFSPSPAQKKTPPDYFTLFFPESLLRMIFDNTNLYCVQKKNKNSNTESVKTSVKEIKTYISCKQV